MLKFVPVCMIALLAGATAALAQEANPPVADPAAKSLDAGTTQGIPAAGANSFTEAQARSRLESHGYTSVTGLIKDADGIWRGKAMKDGLSSDVALDYKGNIVMR